MFNWFRKRAADEDLVCAGLAFDALSASYVRVRFADGQIGIEERLTVGLAQDGPEFRLQDSDRIAIMLRSLASSVAAEYRTVSTYIGSNALVLEEFELRRGNRLETTLALELLKNDRFEKRPQGVLLPAGGETSASRQVVGYYDQLAVSERVRSLEDAGFAVDAVDFEGCVLNRCVPEANVIIDASGEGAVDIWAIGSPMIQVRSVGRVRNGLADRLISEVNTFVHEGILDVKVVSVIGSDVLVRSLAESKKFEGVVVLPFTIANEDSPSWARAYGCATYGISQHLEGGVAYAL